MQPWSQVSRPWAYHVHTWAWEVLKEGLLQPLYIEMAPYSPSLISEIFHSVKKAKSWELRLLSPTQFEVSQPQLLMVGQDPTLKDL